MNAGCILSSPLCCLRAERSAWGTGAEKAASACFERSRESTSRPGSFSTCTIRTVLSSLSISCTCLIKAEKPLESASQFALTTGLSNSIVSSPSPLDFLILHLGKRLGFALSHAGTYVLRAFLNVPNHSNTSFMPWSLACLIFSFNTEKWNQPSVGSMSSQATGARTVLMFIASSCGQMVAI